MLVKDLGKRLTASTGDRRETAWLAQRISVAVARGNAASVLATARPVASKPPRPPPPPGPTPSTSATTQSETAPDFDPTPDSTSPERQRLRSSRNPLDDPDLARYLSRRAPCPPVEPTTPTTQELTAQVLNISDGVVCSPVTSRPDALTEYGALLAEMRREAVDRVG